VQAAGRDGRALWLAAGVLCAGQNTDGVVSPQIVKIAAALAEVNPRRAVVGLVGSGLWHDAGSTCSRCPVSSLGVGVYFFHDWVVYQCGKAGKEDSTVRVRELRRKRLIRNPGLTRHIRQRDRDLCRYCGVLTSWTDRKSAKAGTYDHVDPFGTNSPENVVVACRKCNGIKRDRTPEEAGMLLLPEPAKYQAAIKPDPAERPDIKPETSDNQAGGLENLVLARETGRGQVGPDPGLDSGLIRSGNGNGNGHREG
jgi:hypothetical protein